jgi:hypothetical protein
MMNKAPIIRGASDKETARPNKLGSQTAPTMERTYPTAATERSTPPRTRLLCRNSSGRLARHRRAASPAGFAAVVGTGVGSA